MLVQYFGANRSGQDWVCGDIHGEFRLLERRLEQVGFDYAADRLFSTGDLIDRGPESQRALEFLAQPWFHSVRGNHDDFLLHYTEPDVRWLWRFNGGAWWDNVEPAQRRSFEREFRKLPLAMTIHSAHGTVGVVHADVPQGMEWGAFSMALTKEDPHAVETALWGRSRWLRQDGAGVPGVTRLYCGHTVVGREPARLGNVHFIDTGAAYYGLLTVLPL